MTTPSSLPGPETAQAAENFPVSGERLSAAFIRAYAMVKRACTRTNADLGYLDGETAEAICSVCAEMEAGAHHEHIIVDAFQGGAGTSTNMNMNEVIAALATDRLPAGKPVDPLAHVNCHQSTNDTYPTALRVACLFLMKDLEEAVIALQGALQEKETEFQDTVKMGRTQLQDAVPVTLGAEAGAWAEAIARDRWRLHKARERLRQVNLGGTAVGTGLGAPQDYILQVVQTLRRMTGLNIARKENLIDGTQNHDELAELSGFLKTCGVNLMKIAGDIRLLSSGPDTGLNELHLPKVQAGPSIMPGKVNPVMAEMTIQTALQVMAQDQAISTAAGMGNLELNAFMPLIARNLLSSLSLLKNTLPLFTEKCVRGLGANADRCAAHTNSTAALATVLVPALGYGVVESLVAEHRQSGEPLRDLILKRGIASEETLERLLSPRATVRLGYRKDDYDGIHPPSGKSDMSGSN